MRPGILELFGGLGCIYSLFQFCIHGEGWSYADWMLTMRPGMLGLFGGIANPTGLGKKHFKSWLKICPSLRYIFARPRLEKRLKF